MSSFLASLFLFSLVIAINEAFEYCLGNSYPCPNYCCSNNICCDNCFSSVRYHSDCPIDVGSIVGGIIGFIAFVVIVSLIVACCCGCICSSRTGIQRRGRVVAQPAAAVTVISQDQTYYPQSQCTYPQGQVVYPPAPIGNSDYQRAAYPVYPANQGYINPPNQGYVNPSNQGYVNPSNQGYGNPPAYGGYYQEQK